MIRSGKLNFAVGNLRPQSAVASRLATLRSSGPVRWYAAKSMDAYEEQIYNLLNKELQPTSLNVQDVSGGCGSMFAITVVSDKFTGIPMIKQHRMVNSVLSEEIAKWHGLQLKTSPPP